MNKARYLVHLALAQSGRLFRSVAGAGESYTQVNLDDLAAALVEFGWTHPALDNVRSTTNEPGDTAT